MSTPPAPRPISIVLAPGPLRPAGEALVGGLEHPMTIGRSAMAAFTEQIRVAHAHLPPMRR